MTRTAIITGSTSGIGLGIAEAYAAEGFNVMLNGFGDADEIEATRAALDAKASGTVGYNGADMTKPDQIADLVAQTQADLGEVDVLVNNAGGLVARKTLAEMDLAHWRAVMDLNLTSVFSMTKACLPHLRDNSTIINLASLAGRDGGGPGAVPYATSKGAVMTMTRGLAKELGPKTRVVALCPGMIDTDFHNVFTQDDIRAKVAASTPLKREGSPREIGEFVAFLATDGAGFVNGACIDVNGGVAFS